MDTLVTKKLTKHFGGIKAVDGVSISVKKKTITALIGYDPNNGPSGYSIDDNVTLNFSENTNEPFKGTQNSISKSSPVSFSFFLDCLTNF